MACARDDGRFQGKRCTGRHLTLAGKCMCLQASPSLGGHPADAGLPSRMAGSAGKPATQYRTPQDQVLQLQLTMFLPLTSDADPVTELVRIGKPFPICAELDELLKDAVAHIMDKLIHRDEGLCPTKHRYFLLHPCELGRGPRHTGACCYLDITV